MPVNEKKTKKSKERQKEKGFFYKEIIVPAIVSIMVASITAVITINIKGVHERPKINISGVMPIHLYGPLQGHKGAKFLIHKLAFIFKLDNLSPTPTMVHMAMFEGCTPIPPEIANSFLPENQQLPSGTNIRIHFERYRKSIQRISSSAIIRQDSKSIPAYGISYIGAIFPLEGQFSYHTVRGSFSIEGNCSEVQISNSHPAVSQVFDIKRIHQELPKDIRKEFRSGQISITLFVGSDQISVPPSILKQLKTLKLEKWEKLALPQMYENPDTSFPPIESSN